MPKQYSLSEYIALVRRFENNPAKAGQRVVRKGHLFGHGGSTGTRFCLFAVHTRLGSIEWMVQDAEQMDELTGQPSVIAQAPDARTAFKQAVETAHPRGVLVYHDGRND